jgi:hypothetical protein
MAHTNLHLIGVVAVCAPLLSGCGYLETRPGHPDSYSARFNGYYDAKREWSVKASAWSGSESSAAAAGSATPVFVTAKTPFEIFRARAYAYNSYLKFEAAAYKAQDLQDELAIPLFGAAIAVAATAIGHASTVAIAATGLGGAAAGAGFSYLHPDKDAAVDQSAEAALLCVVDQSKVLVDMSAVPLTLDRAALQDAMNRLETEAGPVLNSTAQADQATRDAVKAVLAAADTSMQSLNAAIAQYVMLPSEIYAAADAVTEGAKSAGARSVDYGSILKSLQASATNQSQTDQASLQVQAASEKVAQASAAPQGTTAHRSVLRAALQPVAATNLALAAGQVRSGLAASAMPAAPEIANPAATAMGGAPAAGSAGTQAAALTGILDNTGMNDLVRVTVLAKLALNDIPNPNFGAVAANIKGCNLGK